MLIENQHMRYGVIRLNINNVIQIEDEDRFIQYKIMLYKAINISGYFIEEMTLDEEENTLNVTMITIPNHTEAVEEALEEAGITEHETVLVERECTSEEISLLMECMGERQELLETEDAQQILKYTWTDGYREKTYTMIEEWEDYEMQNINIPLRVISKFPPQYEGEKWELMKKVILLPINIQYVVNNYIEEEQAFSITIRRAEIQQFIEQAIANNIEFTIEDQYNITEDNVMIEVDTWLLNKAIMDTMKTNKPQPRKHTLYAGFILPIKDATKADDEEVKEHMYNNMKDIEAFIYRVEYKEAEEQLQIYMLATFDNYGRVLREITSEENECTLLGAYDMQRDSEIKLTFKTLEKERKQYTHATISYIKTNFKILDIYKDDKESYVNTRAMIYKTFNIEGYYIEEIIKEDESLNVVIHISSEQANTTLENMTQLGINFIEHEEVSIEVNHEDEKKWLAKYQEKESLLKTKEAKNIQYYTWTDYNMEKCKSEIESWSDKTMVNIEIPTTIISTRSIETLEQYNYMSSRLMKLQIGIEYTLQNIDDGRNTFTITIRGVDFEAWVEAAARMKIPFKCESIFIINEDNIKEVVKQRLLNTSILRTYKTKEPSIKPQEITSVSVIKWRTDKNMNEVEYKALLQENAMDKDVLLENITLDNNTNEGIATIYGKHTNIHEYAAWLNERIIEHNVIGNLIMTSRKDKKLIKILEEERRLSIIADVKFARIEMIIPEIYNIEDEGMMKTKIMIYKTIEEDGYYIENATFNETTRDYIIPIVMIEEQIKALIAAIDNAKIPYKEYEETIMHATIRDIENITNQFSERKEYTKLQQAKHIYGYKYATSVIEKSKLNKSKYKDKGTQTIKEKRVLFSPKYTEKMSPELYEFLRGRSRVETQTTTQDIVGGCPSPNTNENTDRQPLNQKEYDITNKHPLLGIRKGLSSTMVGFENPSNACYMNSLIQAIHNIKIIRDKVISYQGKDNKVLTLLKNIFLAMETKQDIKDGWYINLTKTEIFRYLSMSPNSQEDPDEALQRLIEITNMKMFSFTETREVIATSSVTQQEFNILNINPPEGAAGEEVTTDIEDMISNEISTEDKNEENISTMRVNLTKFNKVIGLKLRRNVDGVTKLLYKVNLKKIIEIEDHHYTLKAAIVHHGEYPTSGHFTAYIHKNNKIYHVNDLKANNTNINVDSTNINIDDIPGNGRVVMVFYERMNEDEENTEEPSSQTTQRTGDMTTSIKIIDNTIKQEISEAHTPDEYVEKLIHIREMLNADWGSMPNLKINEDTKEISILTFGILRGRLPITKDEKLCGFPNCSKMSTSGTERVKHWQRVHECKTCPTHNPFEEILEILGVDIVTRIDDEDKIGYIRNPLFCCPIEGCSFSAHVHSNLADHIKMAHKEKFKTIKQLSPLHKILWLMKDSGKQLTLENFLFKGKVMQCNECGWCTSSILGAPKHPASVHRNLKTQGKVFMRKVSISYQYYTRDGCSKSPFVGTSEQSNNVYFVLSNTDGNTEERSKEDIMNIVKENETIQEKDTTDKDNTQNSSSVIERQVEREITHQETTTTQETDNVPDTTENQNMREDEESEEEYITDQQIELARKWHRKYYNMQESLPKYTSNKRKVLTEALRGAIKNDIMPVLYTIADKKIPDDAPKEEIVNGALCYAFHMIVENSKHALGLINKRQATYKGQRFTLEDRIQNKRKCRDAGSRIVKNIEDIEKIRTLNISEGVQQNEEDPLVEDTLKLAQELSTEFKIAIFNTTNITREVTVNVINDIISSNKQTNIKDYIEHADIEIAKMNEKANKCRAKKAQELFRLSPNRAMRYYVINKVTPNCNIPINDIADELAERWQAPNIEVSDEDINNWRINYKLKESDKEFILTRMQDPETFRQVIETRDITSAHGNDGIGNWALKLVPELSSEMMSVISKIMIKYKTIPTIWNSSRTILLYKKGNPEQLKNWRPLTIAPCLYRAWTCALAQCLQRINTNTTTIFNENQKGFIAGRDGCLEHSNLITELICDANRTKRDIYIASVDFADAFGSIPHDYIKYVINEMNFPEEITEIIANSYDNGQTKVRVNSQESRNINIRKGVKQGCPLSPLLFNFCINPLLDKLDEEGSGYHIDTDLKHTCQAYADDVIICSSTKEGLQQNLDIIESFLKYSCIKVNADKCHTLSYIYRDRKRFFEEEQFTISGNPIPVCNLAESIEYLGTDTTTTMKIRMQGIDCVVEETKQLIQNIGEAPLSLNQKLYAIRTFAIPKLDFVMMSGRVPYNTARDIDTLIRTTINKHIKGVNIPTDLFYTHWKDGGFSLIKLHDRAIYMRLKTFMTLYNSRSFKTRKAMRVFTEEERLYRKIQIIKEGEDEQFMNWKIESKMNKGTDSISIHALRSAQKLNIKIKTDEETGNIIAYTNAAIHNNEDTNNVEIPEYITGEKPNTGLIITTPRELLRYATKNLREESREKLVENRAVGHSFVDIKNASYANTFIGHYKHTLNDSIASWIVKARCNLLFTGTLALKTHMPAEQVPCCPYCGTKGNDTLSHRINGCKSNMAEQTKRHNNIQNIILAYMKNRLGNNKRYKTNSTMNSLGIQLNKEQASLKPDIIAWDEKNVWIVEFSCVYANIGKDGNKLEFTYNQKVNKYTDLVKACEEKSKREVKLFVIIVSSLGAIYSKSIDEIQELLQITKRNRKLLNTILRRISISACIGSYFIFHKMPFKEYKNEYEGVDKEIEDDENIMSEDDNSNDTVEGKEGEVENTNDDEEGNDDEQEFSSEGTMSEEDYSDDAVEGEEGEDEYTDEEEEGNDDEHERSNGGTTAEDDTNNDTVPS